LQLIDEIENRGNGKQPEGNSDGTMVRAILDKITETTLRDTNGSAQ
jgi:geranylgeranyl diphosphate synthase type 3